VYLDIRTNQPERMSMIGLPKAICHETTICN